ncbi:subtilisin-like protein [Karstenula rhodostoma CBS 690.94]|uniref:Subtilisin-like protein n=1 Tax=Karstenula rhodostoma CBS 690.94 TaxID=1392251 RepID=A0A9P4PGR9_9PLEO|nr:subtilisin-like protein [Karstenula rhodostoma CBS 690.94]
MRTSFALAALAASCANALAAPAPQDAEALATPEETVDGLIGLSKNATCAHDPNNSKEVVVMLDKDEIPEAKALLAKLGRQADDDGVFNVMDNPQWSAIVMHATPECISYLEDLTEVKLVDETAEIKSFVTQKTGVPWGLQRISNEAGATGDPSGQDFTYSFDDTNLGAGVDVYVVDTGVRVSHAVFGGRATEGFSFADTAVDGDGHGTHVAGSVAGAKFGVAQNANIIAVKVLGDDGAGSSSDTIAGMNWVLNNHEKRKNDQDFVGSIMSMSWGLQGTAGSVDQAILSALSAGIHVSVAAGNDGADACGTTPANLGGANSDVVTVGSVNINNEVSSFSNIGQCVDIFAPGEQILSAWSTGDNVINFLSGTSMATPQNSGVMAYLMAQNPAEFGQNPKALKAELLKIARQDVVTGSLGGSPNLLLSNGVNGAVQKRSVTGSPASWAKNMVDNELTTRWVVTSDDSPLRF